MPIKYTTKDTTNINVVLKKDNKTVSTVGLGNDNTSGSIEGGISYQLQALDGKKLPLKDGAKDLSFYHLTFENLDLGTYSLEISMERNYHLKMVRRIYHSTI